MKKNLRDTSYLYKINNTIRERKLLQLSQRILIAISGGQDSTYILQIFSHLKKKWEWNLGIIHCDHRWSNHSKLQVEHVARLAIGMHINFYQPVTLNLSRKETLARNWRYEIIKTIAREHNYKNIITAHTASDRIETLLYHLMRGTGLEGIQSINWKRQIPCLRYIIWKNKKNIHEVILKQVFYYRINSIIKKTKYNPQLELVRPLLGSTRLEIRKFLHLFQFSFWPDSSNQLLIISRNRIRHQLIPYIRLNYNPKCDQALIRWAEIAYSENLYLKEITYVILEKIEIHMFNFKYLVFTNGMNVEHLRSCSILFQRRVLKLFLYKNTKLTLNFYYIEHIRLVFLCNKKLRLSLYERQNKKDIFSKNQNSCIYLSNKGKLLLFNNILIYLH